MASNCRGFERRRAGRAKSIATRPPPSFVWLNLLSLLMAVVLALSVAPPRADAQIGPGRKLALVIGNDAYIHTTVLDNPVNDATAMAAVLSSNGFIVTFGKNLAYKDMADDITNFMSKIKDGDLVVIYYAGHGVEWDGVNYLVPVSADFSSSGTIKYQAFPLADITEGLANTKLYAGIIIIDACREADFMRQLTGHKAKSLTAIDPPSGTAVLLAAGPGEDAADSATNSGHGLFTEKLLAAMTKPDSHWNQIVIDTMSSVQTASNERQHPVPHGAVLRDIVFNPVVAGPAAPTAADIAAQKAAADQAAKEKAAQAEAQNRLIEDARQQAIREQQAKDKMANEAELAAQRSKYEAEQAAQKVALEQARTSELALKEAQQKADEQSRAVKEVALSSSQTQQEKDAAAKQAADAKQQADLAAANARAAREKADQEDQKLKQMEASAAENDKQRLAAEQRAGEAAAAQAAAELVAQQKEQVAEAEKAKRIEAERVAQEQMEQARVQATKALADQSAKDQAARDLAVKQAHDDDMRRLNIAAQEKAAADQAERERIAREKDDKDRAYKEEQARIQAQHDQEARARVVKEEADKQAQIAADKEREAKARARIADATGQTQWNKDHQAAEARAEIEKEKAEKDQSLKAAAIDAQREKRVVAEQADRARKLASLSASIQSPKPGPTGGASGSAHDLAMSLGIGALQKGNDHEAAADFEQAVGLNANSDQAFLGRAVAEYYRGFYSKALQDLDRASELNPSNPEVYFWHAQVLSKRGDAKDLPEAVKTLESAIKLRPNYAEAYRLRAVIEFSQTQYQAAVDDFSIDIKNSPSDLGALYGRARANYVLKNYGDAIGDLTELLAQGDDYGGYCTRGLAYMARATGEDLQNSQDDFQKASDMMHGDEPALNRGIAARNAFNQQVGKSQGGFAGSIKAFGGGSLLGFAANHPGVATLNPDLACR